MLLIGLFLIPAVFERFFAVGSLLTDEKAALSSASTGLIISSVIYFLLRRKISAQISLVLLGLFFLVFTEFGFRRYASSQFNSVAKWELEKRGLQTLPEYTAFEGHPFLQFTRR